MRNLQIFQIKSELKDSRDINLDLIRAVAITFVILIHCGCTNVVYTAVPMFIILSGALVLPKDEGYKAFYKKRFRRVLTPFLIWSTIMYILLIKAGKIDSPTVSHFFHLLFSTGVHEVYWYVYEILGLYLLAPLISKGLKALRNNEVLLLCSIILLAYEGFLSFPESFFFQSIAWEKTNYVFYFVIGFYIIANRTAITKNKAIAFLSILSVLISVLVSPFSEFGFKMLIPFASSGMFVLLLSLPIINTPPPVC